MRLSDCARDEWNLGIVPQSAAEIVLHGITRPVSWYPRDSWRIFADPFVTVAADGAVTIFAEMLNHWRGKGEIWSTTIGPGLNPLTALFRPYMIAPVHLSYPSRILHGGTAFTMVEASEAGSLVLWDHSVQPAIQRVMLNRPAVDPTLYHSGGYWWLFCTFADDEPNRRLHLFYSTTLHGPWTPHQDNPIVSDVTRARPAGAIIDVDGKLFRPGQNCARTYGGSLTLSEIITLTPERYEEVVTREIPPQGDYYVDGLHTIAAAGAYTVVDGKRWHHGWANVPRRIAAKLHKSYRRARARQYATQTHFVNLPPLVNPSARL